MVPGCRAGLLSRGAAWGLISAQASLISLVHLASRLLTLHGQPSAASSGIAAVPTAGDTQSPGLTPGNVRDMGRLLWVSRLPQY